MHISVFILDSDSSLDLYNQVSHLLPHISFDVNVMNGNDGLEVMCSKLKGVNSRIGLLPASLLPYPLSHSLTVHALLPRNGSEAFSGDHPLSNYVAVIGAEDDKQVQSIFSPFDLRASWGEVAIAGFGPGDSGLVTRQVDASLAASDVIIYDDLIDADYLNAFRAEKIYAGKRKGKHHVSQDEINELICSHALRGRNVVRLKGGDPLIFGRGAEEYHYLAQRGIRASIIPGISSALAAAAYGIVPLTARGISSSVVFLSGHDLVKLVIPKADTLVFYMGASNQAQLSERLMSEGWGADVPAVVIRNASLPDMQICRYTLASMALDQHPLGSPSIIIVGYSTAADPKAMPDKWLYTGININDFKEVGQCVHSPMIAINSVDLSDQDKQQIMNIKQFDNILFTSRNTVEYFFKSMMSLGLDARHLVGVRIVAVGESTRKALRQMGMIPDHSLPDFLADDVLLWFKAHPLAGKSILIPKPACGIAGLQNWLVKNGYSVHYLTLFQVVMPDNIIRHNLDEFCGVVFTSPSTVTHFMETYHSIPDHLIVKGRGCSREMLSDNKGLVR